MWVSEIELERWLVQPVVERVRLMVQPVVLKLVHSVVLKPWRW